MQFDRVRIMWSKAMGNLIQLLFNPVGLALEY